MELVKDLPEMFDEFSEKRRQAFLDIKEYKDRGVPVIGAYCSYFPRELALAVGAVPIGLCSSSDETVSIAEQVLPKNLCPIVKSSYGFAISDRCPFFHFSDIVVGETTCDGKTKMYELLSDIKEVFVLELPNRQSEMGLKLWKEEIIRLKEYLEDKFGVVITDDMVRDAIRLSNKKRQAVKDFYELMKLDPAPMTGKELFSVLYGNKYQLDFAKAPEKLYAMRKKVLERYEETKVDAEKPRILITGCPMGGDSTKIIDIIEENGGVVVAFENCTGAKSVDKMVDEDHPDVYQALAERYLSIGCPVMTPNDNRIELLGRCIDEFQVDAVVEMVLHGCHAGAIEAVSVKHFVNEEKHIPYMEVVTDFSKGDIAQLTTRLSAFLEML